MEKGLYPLRPYQASAMEALKAKLRGGAKRVVIQAATGSGKTLLAAHVVAGAIGKKNRTAFTVPMLSLIDQTFDMFVSNGIDAGDLGVVQGDHPMWRPHALAQICSVQTLGKRGVPDNVKVVVVDECHLQFAAIKKWMAERPDLIFIGLSATPWSMGMADDWGSDALIVSATTRDLIHSGHLSPFRVYAPTKPDLDGVKIVAGDFHGGMLSERMIKAEITADIVSQWCEKAEGRPTLLFAVNRNHAAVLAEEFQKVGVASAYVDALTEREERAAIRKLFTAGDIKVICSVGTMTTGVDLDVRCIIDARPTKSEILFVQMIGRGLRTAPSKDHCLILDHAGNHLRLGMVSDIHHGCLIAKPTGWAADKKGERPVAKLRPPRECKSCGLLVPVGARVCEGCGAELKLFPGVRTVDGDLVEMGEGGKKPGKKVSPKEWPHERKQRFWSELLQFAQIKGYQRGWCSHAYRERLGVWPKGMRDEPLPVRPDTAGWIRSRNIARAKAAQAGRADGDRATWQAQRALADAS